MQDVAATSRLEQGTQADVPAQQKLNQRGSAKSILRGSPSRLSLRYVAEFEQMHLVPSTLGLKPVLQVMMALRAVHVSA